MVGLSADGAQPGDPNRYIGGIIADDDRRSYFIAPNVGKEAISLNLKEMAGREALLRIITELDVDIFCCNTIPSRYGPLGIDYEKDEVRFFNRDFRLLQDFLWNLLLLIRDDSSRINHLELLLVPGGYLGETISSKARSAANQRLTGSSQPIEQG